MDNLTLEGWWDDEYKAFVEKFKRKKTTDDCYTPPNVYTAIAGWVAREYQLREADFVRPFYPGGDYRRFGYPDGCVVVDNPPFSLLAEIVAFYTREGLRFFLFAPTLTLFSSSSSSSSSCAALPCGVQITYDNGAQVNTSFLTNLEPNDIQVRTVPELYRLVKAADDENRKAATVELPKYVYPDCVLTAAAAYRLCKYGVAYTLRRDECLRIPALDAQRREGKSVFGSGYLLSSRAAAERAAAERAAAERAAATFWQLSAREQAMIEYLDGKKGGKVLTNTANVYKLSIKNTAIVCPACGRKIRGIRLLPGAVLRDVSVMCQPCRRVWIVNIDEASATYESPRR